MTENKKEFYMTYPKAARFTGTKADWSTWSKNFIARASTGGYLEVLKGTVTIPDKIEVLDETNK